MKVQIYWPLILIMFTFIMMIEYMHLQSSNNKQFAKNRTKMKTVLAYSSMKKIELDENFIRCPQRLQIKRRMLTDKYSYWHRVNGTQIYILLVELDSRLKPHYYVRVVAVVKDVIQDDIFCQIIDNGGRSVLTKSTILPIWHTRWSTNDTSSYFNPVLVSCRIPDQHMNGSTYPIGVFLSKKACTSSNHFYDINTKKNKGRVDFTVCVKPLRYNKDIADHLVQWIEINKILGAQFFHIFVDDITTKSRNVLNWYKANYPHQFHIENFTTIVGESENFFHQTWQRRKYEVAAYNKCFNANLHSKYIIPLDLDELIVPKMSKTWKKLVDKFDNFSSLIIRNVYYFRKKYAHYEFFFSENKRSRAPSDARENCKSFISTRNTLTVFNHYALHLLETELPTDILVPFKEAQLNHYKESCDSIIFPQCLKYLSMPRIEDDVIFNYKEEFHRNYNHILEKLIKY